MARAAAHDAGADDIGGSCDNGDNADSAGGDVVDDAPPPRRATAPQPAREARAEALLARGGAAARVQSLVVRSPFAPLAGPADSRGPVARERAVAHLAAIMKMPAATAEPRTAPARVRPPVPVQPRRARAEAPAPTVLDERAVATAGALDESGLESATAQLLEKSRRLMRETSAVLAGAARHMRRQRTAATVAHASHGADAGDAGVDGEDASAGTRDADVVGDLAGGALVAGAPVRSPPATSGESGLLGFDEWAAADGGSPDGSPVPDSSCTRAAAARAHTLPRPRPAARGRHGTLPSMSRVSRLGAPSRTTSRPGSASTALRPPVPTAVHETAALQVCAYALLVGAYVSDVRAMCVWGEQDEDEWENEIARNILAIYRTDCTLGEQAGAAVVAEGAGNDSSAATVGASRAASPSRARRLAPSSLPAAHAPPRSPDGRVPDSALRPPTAGAHADDAVARLTVGDMPGVGKTGSGGGGENPGYSASWDLDRGGGLRSAPPMSKSRGGARSRPEASEAPEAPMLLLFEGAGDGRASGGASPPAGDGAAAAGAAAGTGGGTGGGGGDGAPARAASSGARAGPRGARAVVTKAAMFEVLEPYTGSAAGGSGGCRGVVKMRAGPHHIWFGGGGGAVSGQAVWCGLVGVDEAMPDEEAIAAAAAAGKCVHRLCGELEALEREGDYEKYMSLVESVLRPRVRNPARGELELRQWRQLIVVGNVFAMKLVEEGRFGRALSMLGRAGELLEVCGAGDAAGAVGAGRHVIAGGRRGERAHRD